MKRSNHDLSEVLAQYYLRGAEDNYEKCQGIHCHGGDRNRAPLKWEPQGLSLYLLGLFFTMSVPDSGELEMRTIFGRIH